ncbi:MAG TPA: IS110 family transposase [Pyrinomonadaceae bacterium]
MKNTTIAIDLAKSVFEVGISHDPGHVAETYRLSREQIAEFMAKQKAATVVMEACGSAHYWGRRFGAFGHKVRLLPPLYVRPYVQRSKTDRADVKGMLEASRNSAIRPVPVKSESQQQLTSLHRMRSGWMTTRTMRINAARGLLREFGFVFPVGSATITGRIRELIEDADTAVLMPLRELLHQLIVEIDELKARIKAVEKQLEALAAQTPVVALLRTIPGIGLLTSTALVGFVGDVGRFRSGRHFACYLGLTPREHSSGSRRRLGRISKQGDVYLRTLLIHGARAVLVAARLSAPPDRLRAWGLELQRRCGYSKAAVAVANKLARIAWAVWKSGKAFQLRPQG